MDSYLSKIQYADLGGRIDKYAAATSSTEPVSSSRLPFPVQRGHQSHTGGSPSFSMRTNPSVPSHTMDISGSRHNQQHSSYLPPAAIPDSGPPMFPAQAARIPTYSNTESQSPDLKHLQQGNISKLAKPLPMSQPVPILGSNWVDRSGQSQLDGTEPRMFPGIVHERIQRSGTRQGSSSEYDPGELGAGLSNSQPSTH